MLLLVVGVLSGIVLFRLAPAFLRWGCVVVVLPFVLLEGAGAVLFVLAHLTGK